MPRLSLSSIQIRAKKIRFLILDVDGVMTDGSIIYDDSGQELKVFNVRDGFGMAAMRKAGVPIALVSGRASKGVVHRARELGVREVYQNILDKSQVFSDLKRKYRFQDREIAFMTDDITDLPVMRRAGLSIAVADAEEDVKRQAHWVTKRRGGRGAVREVCELILKSQGRWEKLVRPFYGV